jgi:hypothetical protein
MSGVSLRKVGYVGIVKSAAWDAIQVGSQHLWPFEAHDACRRFITRAESLSCQVMHEIERAGLGRLIVPRRESPPEHRQESIGSEARDQEQPVQRI